MRTLHGNLGDTVRSVKNLFVCLVLIFTAQAASLFDEASTPTRRPGPVRPPSRDRLRGQSKHDAWTVRGGNQSDGGMSGSKWGRDARSNGSNRQRDHDPPLGGETSNEHPAVDKMAAMAADLRAKTEHIATHIQDRKVAIAADLKATQEKITDEVLRDRSPEAFGELGGHASPYDSATAGMDVANRRSFFLGIRRIVLLAQVVELLGACLWQAAFPYGGMAGFLAAVAGDAAGDSSTDKRASFRDIIAGGGADDGRGRLGLAMAASLGQFSLYTMLLVWFGCDRVVLRAVRLTGWEHGAAAAWALLRLITGPGGRLVHLAACAWLAGMTFLCAYFGRQL